MLVLEIGPAGEWPLSAERKNFGGTIGAEVTPIEDWLEVELGFEALGTAGHTELSGDLLFKKPFQRTSQTELMPGVGPALSRTINGPQRETTWSVEFGLDLFHWSYSHVGWFVEPTWSIAARNGKQSVGATAGLIVGLF